MAMHRRRRRHLVAALTTAAVLLTGCAGSSATSSDVPDATDAGAVADTIGTETESTTALDDGDTGANAPEILQFTSDLVGGGQLDATTLPARPTAFWFWSPT